MIVTAKELIDEASKKKIAVGAFNVGNMEMLKAALEAAEEMNTPIIIQIAESRLKHSPLELMAPMMVEGAENSKLPIAVQLDHGKTLETVTKALDYGFSSVMFDGSHLPIKENVSKTNEIYEIARKYGASVEAELGVLAGNEGDGDKKLIYTRPEDAVSFSKDADFDALAIAIGNAHGNYKEAPKLQFDILKEIHGLVDKPLVLHGGTGISPKDFQNCISFGIRKINIATANFDAAVRGALSMKEKNYFSMNEAMVEEIKANIVRHIKIFNMEALG